jgi:hypothetical protein
VVVDQPVRTRRKSTGISFRDTAFHPRALVVVAPTPHRALQPGRPQRDIELFAEPVRRFVAEFSALAGLGRISEPYAAGVAAQLIPTVLPYTLGSAAMFTTETINGRPLGADAFDVMVSLAAGRSLGDGVAPDVSRLIDVFPYYGPPYTAADQRGLLPMPRHGVAL